MIIHYNDNSFIIIIWMEMNQNKYKKQISILLENEYRSKVHLSEEISSKYVDSLCVIYCSVCKIEKKKSFYHLLTSQKTKTKPKRYNQTVSQDEYHKFID